MKVLVTGGTGYIGSHTVIELQQAGYEVIIIDNLSNSNIEVLDGIHKITGQYPIFEKFDICNSQDCNNFFSKYKGITAVIHFAAYKAVGESVEKPLMYYYNNLVSLLNLLDKILSHNINYLVYSSSCTVYGQPESLPVAENAPVQEAKSPYGNTKQISEEIIKDTIHANKKISCISLRYFNPIGAHPNGFIGELPIGEPNNLVPYITQTAYGIREYLRVFGNNYNTHDGTCIRDYIDVVDLSKAHIAALQRMLVHKNINNFEVFNLGAGKGYSVMEVVQCFEKVTGIRLKYKILNRRPGDIERVYADPQKANARLNWKATTSLDNSLLSAWNWEKYYRKKLNC
ncbi:MAG: UDP-glucose 4-epimerase GalE [Bacteroidia bacterium]|nr:UDP-glucose 4-epimerase GalE [Bacteroidia bacterium]